MYTLVRSLGSPVALLEQLPQLTAALLITETFLRLGSFSAEACAFLAIWAALDACVVGVRRLLRRGGRVGR